MKLFMVGTYMCTRCKSEAPIVEDYCKEHNIDYNHMYINDAPKSVLNLLSANNIKQAPAYILYGEDDSVLYVGNNVLEEFFKN